MDVAAVDDDVMGQLFERPLFVVTEPHHRIEIRAFMGCHLDADKAIVVCASIRKDYTLAFPGNEFRHYRRVGRGNSAARSREWLIRCTGPDRQPACPCFLRQNEWSLKSGSRLQQDRIAELRRIDCILEVVPFTDADRPS